MRTRRTWGRLLAALAVALVAAVGIAPHAARAVDGNVAKIGDTEYETLNDAVANVGEGETIKLIADVDDATGITVPSGENFTIDFAGHTYTLTGPGAGSTNTETNGFQLLRDSTIVFKNGTVNVAPSANNIMRLVQSYADVTFENMTFDARNQVGGEDLALSFNNGSVTFRGDTSVVMSKSSSTAFDVCLGWSQAYQNVSVTFDDTYVGEIGGVILYDSTSSNAALTVNGKGTFSGIKTSASSIENPTIEISGGKFSSDVSEFLADGMMQDKNGVVVEQPDVASVDGKGYKSFEEAVAAAQDGQTVTLLTDASTKPVNISKGVTINLGGHKLSIVSDGGTSALGLDFTAGSSTLRNGTVVDERASGSACGYIAVRATGADTALATENVAIQTYVPDSLANYNYQMRVDGGASLTLNNGTAISELNPNGLKTAGEQSWGTVGVSVLGTSQTQDTAINPTTATELTVNDGASVVVSSFGISGNGSNSNNTIISINGGDITSADAQAIYHPQHGLLSVSGGSIQGVTGIEMRAGELTVGGGTVKGGDGVFAYEPNGNGSTTENAAIVVAQHTTKLPIKVTLWDGTFEGGAAFAQADPQGNADDGDGALDKIDISITGGEFKGEVFSENFKDAAGAGFVSGGSFSDASVGDYLVKNAAVAVTSGETPYDIYPTADMALENGGAHIVVDKQGNTWVFANKDDASDFADANGSNVKTVTHTVTFDDCLPSTTNQVVEVENGSPVTRPADPACEGWKFLGWYEFANGSYAAVPYDFAAPVRSDLTLYAKWEQIEEEPEVTPQNPSESKKDDGLAKTGDSTMVAPLAVAGIAGIAALGSAVTLRRRSK